MRHFEINDNLGSDINYNLFSKVICDVMDFFIDIFGENTMNSVDLFVDNSTTGSGHTPIAIPVLNKYVIIKLKAENDSLSHQIAFQFSHELMHYVFYVYKGLNKELADEREESICTAVSLIVLKNLYPEGLEIQKNYLKTLSIQGYKRGVEIAEYVNYDMQLIKNMI